MQPQNTQEKALNTPFSDASAEEPAPESFSALLPLLLQKAVLSRTAAIALLPLIGQTLVLLPEAKAVEPNPVFFQAQAAPNPKNCIGLSCKGTKYVNSQLSKIQQEIASLESQIQTLEASQGQADIEAYKKLITERKAEIADQKRSLQNSVRLRQQQLVTQKLQLAGVGAIGDEVNFAGQVLAQNVAYQQSWKQLQRVEQGLAAEFGSANTDGTALNEIYSDYEFHQKELASLASEAVGNYIANNADREGGVPQFIKDAPAALGTVQQLAISTYEDQVDQLRLATIAQIEQSLNVKQRQLISDLSKYETLKRDLASAQQQLRQYEQARADIDANPSDFSSQLSSQSLQQEDIISSDFDSLSTSDLDQKGNVWTRAKQAVLQVPESSVTQGVLYTMLAAGVVAIVMARRRDPQTVTIPQLDVKEPTPAVTNNAYRSQSVASPPVVSSPAKKPKASKAVKPLPKAVTSAKVEKPVTSEKIEKAVTAEKPIKPIKPAVASKLRPSTLFKQVSIEPLEPVEFSPVELPSSAAKPKAVESKVAEPKVAEPKAVELKAVEPKIIEPKVIEPTTVEPKAVEPEVVEPEAVELKAVEPKIIEPKVVKPKAVEPKAVEPEVVELKAVEPKAVEPKVAESKAEQLPKEDVLLSKPGASLPVESSLLDVRSPEADEPDRQNEISSFFDNTVEEDLPTEAVAPEPTEPAQPEPQEVSLLSDTPPSPAKQTQLPLQEADMFSELSLDWMITDFNAAPVVPKADVEAADSGQVKVSQTVADMAAKGEGSVVYVQPIVEDATDEDTAVQEQTAEPLVAEEVEPPAPVRHPLTLAEAASM